MLMRILRAAAIAALVALGLVGLNNARAWPGAQTGAQRLAVVVAVVAGVLGLASAVALWRRRSAPGALLVAWGVLVTAAAGLAPWAWGSATAPVWLTAAAVGAGLAAVVAGIAWWARAP